ncbi:MAG: hypothetical protein ACR2NU_03960 [Aeoliella sp.]
MSSAQQMFVVGLFVTLLSCVAPSTSWGGIDSIGDYNFDGFVDAEDAAVWAANYQASLLVGSGGAGLAAIPGDGDLDGDVDQDDYDLMFDVLGTTPGFLLTGGNLIGPASTALIYNSTTGELSVDDTHAGAAVTSFFLTGLSAADVPGMSFPYQRFVPGTPPGDTVGLVVDGSTSGVGQTDINLAGLPSTPFSFGNILPTGLTEAEFASNFSGSFYLTDSSTERESFTLFVTQIPEPTSCMLLALAAGVLLGIGRMRSN